MLNIVCFSLIPNIKYPDKPVPGTLKELVSIIKFFRGNLAMLHFDCYISKEYISSMDFTIMLYDNFPIFSGKE